MTNKFNLLCDLYENNLNVYVSHLIESVKNLDVSRLQSILKLIAIPSSQILKHEVLNKCNVEILNVLITHQLEYDKFIILVANKLLNQTVLNLEDLRTVVGDVPYNDFCDDYKCHLIIKLIKNNYSVDKITLPSYLYLNILSNYRSCCYYMNKILCTGIFNAKPQFVKNMLITLEQKNLKFHLEIITRSSHMDLIQWLLKNLEKNAKGEDVGWKCGPDSALWPSNNPDDYVSTLELIKPIIKF